MHPIIDDDDDDPQQTGVTVVNINALVINNLAKISQFFEMNTTRRGTRTTFNCLRWPKNKRKIEQTSPPQRVPKT